MAEEENEVDEMEEEQGEDGDAEEPEPDPGPDTLEPMLDLMEEIESHRTRLKLVVQQGVSDPNVPMVELVDTVMSLLQDIANRTYDNLYEIRRYLVEQVEPAMLGEAPEQDTALAFDDEEAMRLARVLSWVKTALSQGERPSDETLRKQVESLEADVDVLLMRMKAEATEQLNQS